MSHKAPRAPANPSATDDVRLRSKYHVQRTCLENSARPVLPQRPLSLDKLRTPITNTDPSSRTSRGNLGRRTRIAKTKVERNFFFASLRGSSSNVRAILSNSPAREKTNDFPRAMFSRWRQPMSERRPPSQKHTIRRCLSVHKHAMPVQMRRRRTSEEEK